MSASTSSLRTQADHTVDELKALLREAEAALSSAGAEAGSEVNDLRERIRSAFDEGKNKLSQAADLARRQAARADELVRANPYASLGIAAGAGLLLGFFVSRCQSRD